MKTLEDNIWCNLTPHEIVVRMDSGANHRIPPYGEVLRVDTRSKQIAMTGSGVRINSVRPSREALAEAVAKVREHLHGPSSKPVIVIVSGIALDWIHSSLGEEERYRVVSPDTSPGSAIREPSGRMCAVRALRIGS